MDKEKRHFKFIVIGCGGIGSSALYWLSRIAGSEVLGIEQFTLGHHNGGSQDHSRIIRLSYDIPAYTSLAQQAYNAWHVVEKESGVKLITTCGGIVFGSKDDPHVQSYASAMKSQGIPFEQWDHKEIKEHYPQFTLGPNDTALFQPDSGIVDARMANQVHIVLARARGAQVLENTKVTNIKHINEETVQVCTNNGTFTCERLVVTTGAWTNDILQHVGIRLPITVSQEQVTYYATPNVKEFIPERFPIWISYNHTDKRCYYGFPVYGEVATKVGHHEGGFSNPVTADSRTFNEDEERTKIMTEYLSQYIPRSIGPILYTKTCLYDILPDRNFLLDMIPNHPNISVFIGTGHSFKFASIVGKILSEFAATKTTSYAGSLELFGISRFLSEPSSAKM